MPVNYPMSQSDLTKRIELFINRVAKRESQRAGSFDPKAQQRIAGMEHLAWELGVDCNCIDTTQRGQRLKVCRCRPMTAAQRARHLSGEHCRDGQGVFVPVSQCVRRGKAKTTERKRKTRKKRR